MPLFAYTRISEQRRNPNILYHASPVALLNPDRRANRLTAIAVVLLNNHFEHTEVTRGLLRNKLVEILDESARGNDRSGGANAAKSLQELRTLTMPNAVSGFAIASLLMNNPESPRLHIAYSGTGGVYVAHTRAKNIVVTPGVYQPTGQNVYCVPRRLEGKVPPPEAGYDEYYLEFNQPKAADYKPGCMRVVVGNETTLGKTLGMGGTGINTIFPFMTVVKQKEAYALAY